MGGGKFVTFQRSLRRPECGMNVRFYIAIITSQLRGQPSAHGKKVGESTRRYSSYLTNMLSVVLGIPSRYLGICRDDLSSPDRDFDFPESLMESKSSFEAFRRRFPVVERKSEDQKTQEEKEQVAQTCPICMDTATSAAGPLIRCCGTCVGGFHANCWNQLAEVRRLDPVDEKDPQVGNIQQRCPVCRGPFRIVPRYVELDEKDMVSVSFREFDGTAELINPGEEMVVHPWVLFLLKVPRQFIVAQVPLFRFVFSANGIHVPLVLRCMREDDEVIANFGPMYLVKSGTGPYWPRTWENPNLVRRVGFSIIRSLFSSQDWNDEWMVNQMLSMISREVPLWENAEAHCRDWVRSDEAMEFHRTIVLSMVRKKDAAQKIKWVKQQLGSDMSSENIEFYYMCFEHLLAIKILFFMLVLLSSIPYKSLFDNPSRLNISVALLWTLFMWRVGRICGFLFFEKMPKLRVLNSLQIWKTCSKRVDMPPICPGARINVSRKLEVDCPAEKGIEVYGCVISGAPVVIPNGCGHDMEHAVRIRFIFDRAIDAVVSSDFLDWATKLLASVHWAKWTWFSRDEWLAHLVPTRRAGLVDEDLGNGELYESVGADIFVKGEAYVGKVWTKFKARMIQARKASFQILVGSFFYSLYKWFAQTFSSGKHVYSVNLNALELGKRAFCSFGPGRTVYEGDASSWDGSVTEFMLDLEIWFLNVIIPYRPPWLTNVLKNWKITKGAAKGVNYSCNWGRRSGDMWTSTFNTLLNICITDFVWKDQLIEGTYNGDDNWFVVMGDTCALPLYSGLGLTMELVPRVNWRELEFCSGKFYMTERGPKWGLKPFRQLCKFGINFGRHSDKKFKGLLFGNAMSMLPIAGHIPIFGDFLRSIVRTSLSSNVVMVEVKREEWQITDSIIDDVHPEEIEEFKRRYGYSDADYSRLELWAQSVHIDQFPMALDDELFLRGARVDCGFEGQPRLDHKNHESWIECVEGSSHSWFVLVEEIVCWYFPLFWVFLGVFETALGSHYALLGHLVLEIVRRRSIFLSLLLHVAFNVTLGSLNLLSYVNGDHYGRPSQLLATFRRGVREVGLGDGRRPGVFTPMPDRTGLCKYRLTGFLEAFFSLGQWGGLLKLLSKNRNTNRRRRRRTNQGRRPLVVVNNSATRSRRRRRGRASAAPAVTAYACARLNPFMAGVNGIRCPDEFGYPTGTAVMRGSFQLTADSGGYGSRLYLPFVGEAQYTPLNTTSGTITWAGGSIQSLPQYQAYGSVASLGRCVSWGLRITADSSLTNSQGHLWISHMPLNFSQTLPYFDAPTTEAQSSALPLSEKFSITELAQQPIVIPGRPFDDGVFRFRDVNAQFIAANTNTVESSPGWCGILVYMSGGIASTTAINIEVIEHVEYIQDGSSLYGFVDTLPAPYEPKVLEAASRISEAAPVGLIENAVSTFEAAAGYAGRLVGAASSLYPIVHAGYKAAGQLASARGYFHAPPSIPRLTWDDEKW